MAAGTTNFTQGSSTVVGYFANGEDAHSAIHALIDAGFAASQIGAAFHTSPGYAGTTGSGSLATAGKGISYPEGEGSSVGVTTSAANETAVTPALGGGSGTGMAGAGKPGPITGSDLSHLDLPREIESTLPHDQPGSAPIATAPGTGGFTEAHTHAHHSGWFEKLTHVFGGHKETPSVGSNLVSKESQNFGTGEGHLGIGPEAAYARPYSHSAFESSFTGMGVEPGHSRHLALRLAHGGAVITVSATGRIPEVEIILERHNGVVRFEAAPFDDALPTGDRHVAVFGAVHDAYPSSEEVVVPSESVLHR